MLAEKSMLANMRQTAVAGIDSSTQSCKVVVRDLETGAILRTGSAAHPPGTEVDPEAWWQALLGAVDAAGGLDDVAAVSIAAQQHGLVALDGAGRVVRPAMLWHDTRAATAADALIEEFGAESLARRTGLVPVSSFTISKLRWLRDHEPEAAERVAAVALPHDWLTWRLRGFGPERPDLDELVTDRSDASGTGYWRGSDPDSVCGDWDRELVIATLGHDVMLPRVLAPRESAGRTASHSGIPEGLVVGAGAGDNAGAALGLHLRPGDAVVSIGTSGTSFARTEHPTVDPTGTIAGFAAADGGYLPLVATLNAARVLDTTASLLGVDHAGLSELALAAPSGAGGLVLQPYFAGERTPNLPDATATMFGMTHESATRENFARAAIEGMLCGLAEGLAALRAAGVDIERVLLIGGAAASPAVRQVASEVIDVRVTVPNAAEYVALGASAQAAVALRGRAPDWRPPGAVTLPLATRPEIQQRYRAHVPKSAED